MEQLDAIISRLDTAILLGIAFAAGKIAQRVGHLEKKLDHLMARCPYCIAGHHTEKRDG